MELLNKIFEEKIIAIVRGIESAAIVDTATALVAGGIRIMEVAYDHRSPEGIQNTLDAIAALKKHPELGISIGCGTVLTVGEVDMAIDAGADFMISPDTRPEVIRYTKEKGRISMPGALTPTEVSTALEAGADIIKIFPAGLMGPDYVRALKGPLGHAHYFAVGNVGTENMAELMAAGYEGFGIGGSLVNSKLVKNRDFKKITETASLMMRIVNG